mgnify:CR=1 FL=1
MCSCSFNKTEESALGTQCHKQVTARDTCVVFHTKALPDLHMFFAESKQLCFEDMPGGEIMPEQVKSRYAQARAELIPVSKRKKNLWLQVRVCPLTNLLLILQSPRRRQSLFLFA